MALDTLVVIDGEEGDDDEEEEEETRVASVWLGPKYKKAAAVVGTLLLDAGVKYWSAFRWYNTSLGAMRRACRLAVLFACTISKPHSLRSNCGCAMMASMACASSLAGMAVAESVTTTTIKSAGKSGYGRCWCIPIGVSGEGEREREQL